MPADVFLNTCKTTSYNGNIHRNIRLNESRTALRNEMAVRLLLFRVTLSYSGDKSRYGSDFSCIDIVHILNQDDNKY